MSQVTYYLCIYPILGSPNDVEYLNKPISNYTQMRHIFSYGLATGKFAMGSSEPLGAPSLSTLTRMSLIPSSLMTTIRRLRLLVMVLVLLLVVVVLL
jgi:hypothetical protein